MSSNQYTVNIVNADELYIGGRKIEALGLGVLVSDDPTYGIGIGTDKPRLRLDISGNDGIRIPVGTTSERPDTDTFLVVNGVNVPNGATNLLGILRYNTTTEKYEAVCNSESLSVDPSWCNFVIETGTVGNNKVGINKGTGIPSHTLDVNGQIGINDYIIHNGNTNTKIGFPTNNTLTITTDDTERMRVDSSGVGIGVGHPQTTKSELHVKGSISVYKNTRNTDNQATSANIYLDVNAIGKGSGIIWKPEYDDGGSGGAYTKDSAGIYFQNEGGQRFTGGLSFYTNNHETLTDLAEERMRIDASGNVGIGTTSPGYKLQVVSGVPIYDPDFTTPDGPLYWYGSLYCGHVDGGITMGRIGPTHVNCIQSRYTHPSTLITNNNLAINPFGGNVGIGTTSPQTKLHVSHGDDQTENTDTIRAEGGIVAYAFNVDVHQRCRLRPRGQGGDLLLYNGYDPYETIQVHLTAITGEPNYINNGGNVGIGTDSPGEKLEVNGDILVGSTWGGGTVHRIYGDRSDGEKKIEWHYDNPPSGGGTQIIDNHSIGFSVNSALRMKITDDDTTFGSGNNQLIVDSAYVNASTPGLEFNSSAFFLLKKGFGATSHWNMIFDRGDRYWSGFRSTHHWDCYDGDGLANLGKYDVNSTGETMFLQYYSHGDLGLCYLGGNVSIGGGGTTAGYLCIGSNNPVYPIDIRFSGVNGNWSGTYRTFKYNDSILQSSVSASAVGIKAVSAIWAAGVGFIASSDRRIKENIRDVPDDLSLKMLRALPVSYYDYKDKLMNGGKSTIGFIAQEVKEIMPMAVSLQTNIIPNEMRNLDNFSWESITDLSGNETFKLIVNDLEDVSGNTKYRFYCSNEDLKEVVQDVSSLENEPKSFIFEKKWDSLFLYGKEIDDFHTIDKQKIFAMAFSATQEIDRIQQQHAIEIANIKLELEQEKNKMIDILERLNAAGL